MKSSCSGHPSWAAMLLARLAWPLVLPAVILALLAWPLAAAAEVPDTLWTRTYGGTNIDIGHSVQQTADGGFVIGGYTRSYGTMSGRNALLVKVDTDGESAWIEAYGGDDDDEGYAVRQTADGGYILAGHTKSFGGGDTDVLLIKTDAEGALDWQRTYGGANDDEGYAVLQTSDFGYLVAGVTSSSGAGSRDVWLIRTDAQGIEKWNRTHGGLSSDGAWSVAPTADGGFIVAGWTYSNGPGYLGNAWLLKTDGQGIEEWNRAFGGSDVDRAYSVQQTTDGGYILAGYTDSFGAGLYDMLLIKADSLGNQEWLETFGGSGRDYAQAVEQTADGGYILAGYTLSYGAGGDDVWLVKTDADGDAQWDQTYGGSASDVAYSVTQTTDGGFIVTGHTLSYGAGLHDVWLIRLAGGLTAVGEVAQPWPLLRNDPNPFHPQTTIRYAVPADGAIRLEIFDAAGRRVRTLVDDWVRAGVHQVIWDGRYQDGGAAASGVYFYRLRVNGTEQTRKMVLMR
jgi:hypothetical protein